MDCHWLVRGGMIQHLRAKSGQGGLTGFAADALLSMSACQLVPVIVLRAFMKGRCCSLRVSGPVLTANCAGVCVLRISYCAT